MSSSNRMIIILFPILSMNPSIDNEIYIKTILLLPNNSLNDVCAEIMTAS